MRTIPNLLSIAGSDSGGGAGIQADLKTFSALGAYGMTVITSLTAQNTQNVNEVFIPPVSFFRAQLEAVFQDIRVDAIKIGMLANADLVRTLAQFLNELDAPRPYTVLDPVMVAKSGQSLLAEEAVSALLEELLPLVDLITPNLPEAAKLLDESPVNNVEDMRKQAQRLRRRGAQAVLLKGGHLAIPDFADILAFDDQIHVFKTQYINTRNTHGTGCTLSSALAVCVPRYGLFEGVQRAQRYVYQALEASSQLDVGHGHGPTQHFHQLWQCFEEDDASKI